MKTTSLAILAICFAINADSKTDLPTDVESYYDALNAIYCFSDLNELAALIIGSNNHPIDKDRMDYFENLISSADQMVKHLDKGIYANNPDTKNVRYNAIQGIYKIEHVEKNSNEIQITLNVFELDNSLRVMNVGLFSKTKDKKEYVRNMTTKTMLRKKGNQVHKWIKENDRWYKIQGDYVDAKFK
jgi:hypothetical protein